MANAPPLPERGPAGGAAPALAALPPAGHAGFGVRLAARLVDLVFNLIVAFGAGVASGAALTALAVLGTAPADWAERAERAGWVGLLFSTLAMVLYHTLAEGVGGATIGKALFGLRVRREDLSPCGLGGAFRRSLAYFVDALFFGLVAYNSMSASATGQRVGDKWAKTVVVKAASLEQREQPLPGVLGGIALSLFIPGAVMTLGEFVKAL